MSKQDHIDKIAAETGAVFITRIPGDLAAFSRNLPTKGRQGEIVIYGGQSRSKPHLGIVGIPSDAYTSDQLREASHFLSQLAETIDSIPRTPEQRLATLLRTLYSKHYPTRPPVMPLDTIDGLIDQLDNLTSGLARDSDKTDDDGWRMYQPDGEGPFPNGTKLELRSISGARAYFTVGQTIKPFAHEDIKEYRVIKD